MASTGISTVVRPMSAPDLVAFGMITAASCRGSGWPLDDPAELSRPDRCYLVACLGEEIVGFAGALVAPDAAQVLTVAVDPAHRRRGIGRILLTGLEAELRARGVAEISLEVRAGNQAARDLYRDLGYLVVGLRPRYYPDGEDAVLMRRG